MPSKRKLEKKSSLVDFWLHISQNFHYIAKDLKTLNGCSSKLYLLIQFLRYGPQILTQTSKLDSKKYCSFRFFDFLLFWRFFGNFHVFRGPKSSFWPIMWKKNQKFKNPRLWVFFKSKITPCVQISSFYLEKPRRR